MTPDKTVWQSHVFHKDAAFFVSTIWRDYETAYGCRSRGMETIVWAWNPATRERGDMLHQAGGVHDHQEICRSLIANGTFPKDDNDA